MARQYAPKAVLRHLPLDLLRRFLDLQDVPTGPAWDTLADGDTRAAYQRGSTSRRPTATGSSRCSATSTRWAPPPASGP